MYKSYTVNKNDADQRLDKFLTKAVKALPQSMLYKALRTKKIKVNRKRAEPSQRLQEGDVIELYLKDDFFSEEAKEQSFRVLTPSLNIAYEDENIIVCDKRQGLIVHSDDKEDINTLINHIKAHLYRKGEYDPDGENSFAPALCNRIDRNTGGLVIAAKTASALRFMNEKIKNNEIGNVGKIHGFCHLTAFCRYYLIIICFKESRDEIQYIPFILHEEDLIFVFVHPKLPPS
jgi:23S rRNA pseudouridine955/2504/2580 synthase